MGTLKLTAASGGGSVSIEAPASSSNNRVITLPDITDGTLVTSQSSLDATKLTGNLPAISGASLTGISAGITHARTYRLTTGASHTGTHLYLTSNWEYADDASTGQVGSGWSLPSSGVFSFPTTGVYLIQFQGYMYAASGVSNGWPGIDIQVTQDNGGAYDNVAGSVHAVANIGATSYWDFSSHAVVDVTDVSNVKFRIKFISDSNGGTVTINGDSNQNSTAVTLIRLGDT
tara:strand:- start:853 stop:1545 length:693 start_codon:yes stop_codon:yes gene_type:complete